ncbi:MAG TPA: phosphoribosylformylglycinamidine synthase I [Candidatus Saccharimonadales bacterium]|nr:phosphoribosylformylglycinamidine synthase I [Candidatus Saccharimonadales bacterium]
MQKRSLRVGILRFPGSNCDWDAYNFFKKFGHKSEFIWYKDTQLLSWDVIVLPGGFAFGDRVYKKATEEYSIDPGVLALQSPALKIIFAAAEKKIPILGICNGFQILVKAGLLPGKLEQNTSKQFFCDITTCEVMGASFFGDKSMMHKKFHLPVAHGYGRYVVSKKQYQELQKNSQIFLRYIGLNPNGSVENIAGVSNKEKNIFGLMPHPERSEDGKYFMKAIEKYVTK